MTKVKPCPFCGNMHVSIGWERSTVANVGGEVLRATFYKIGCRCGASMSVRMKVCDYDDDDLPTAYEAAKIAMERWNRRVIE